MDGLKSVGAAGSDQSSVALSEAKAAMIAPHPEPMQIIPPGGGAVSDTLASRLWSSLGAVSNEMKSVHEALGVRVSQPAQVTPATGDMLQDMRNTMADNMREQNRLLDFQLKMSVSSNTFGIGVAMVQSVQHSARTLLQDK